MRFLKRIFPASSAETDLRFELMGNALASVAHGVASLQQSLQTLLSATRESALVEQQFLRRLLDKAEEADGERERLSCSSSKLIEGMESLGRGLDSIMVRQGEIQALAERGRRQSMLAQKASEEAVWAHLFHDVTSGSTWLTNQQFAAGRWAVGYAYLYVLYRILDEVKPVRVLDIGLGQTSRLIAQYVSAHPGTEHVVVESDRQWIDFVRNSFEFSERSKIVQLDYVCRAFRNVENVRQYKGFREAFEGQKFDVVSIDAPYAGDMTEIGRVDLVDLLPDIMSDSFAILMDDAQRHAEAAAFEAIVSKLKEGGIEMATGVYRSVKDISVVTSKDYKFLTSL